MGFIVKPKSSDVYGALIHLYPQSFQKYYGTTMKQTFDDLLDAEESSLGRIKVWARAVLDLPLSAAKEHLINGKDFVMNRNTKLLIISALIAIVIVGLASFWEGNLKARSTVVVERVTVSQLADAMQQDGFYSTYGDTAVLFSGKIESIKVKDNASLVTFVTGRPYSVVCQFPTAVTYKSGQTISVAAPAGSAERLSQGVLLHECISN